MVKIQRKIMIKNDCYKVGRKSKKKGIMIHLTATSGVMAADWFRVWNKPGVPACVHYIVDDKEIWQYLDDDHRSWHAGRAVGNSDYISIEGCEPPWHYYKGATPIDYDVKKNEKFFFAMYNNQVDLAVHLCKKYKFTEKDIIGHIEAGRKGIATRSGDPHNLYLLHGKSMDIFRADVKKKLGGKDKTAKPPKPKKKTTKKVWHSFISGDEVRELQLELNRQFNRRLAVDGYFGILTIKALVNVRKGARGALTRLIQRRLQALDYNIGSFGADGVFGNATDRAVRKLQRDRGLAVDGIVGRNTWKTLFKK